MARYAPRNESVRHIEKEYLGGSKVLDILPVTGVFGAQISNLNLANGWDDDLISKIRAALAEYKVLLIRGQATLSAQQLAEQHKKGNLVSHGRGSHQDV